jgi:hypothetical protein
MRELARPAAWRSLSTHPLSSRSRRTPRDIVGGRGDSPPEEEVTSSSPSCHFGAAAGARAKPQIAIMFLLVFALAGLSPSASADVEVGRRAFERRDYAAAYRAWVPLAKAGLAEAQYELGMLYVLGEGVPADSPEVLYNDALKWFRLAAVQGHATAQWQVGFFHENGWGVSKNDAEAAKWYHLAAQQGQPDAQYDLATLYREGRGVAKDPRRAARWYLGAAHGGHVDAQFTIGFLYRAGDGIEQNDFAAAEWYRKAADQGVWPGRVASGLRPRTYVVQPRSEKRRDESHEQPRRDWSSPNAFPARAGTATGPRMAAQTREALRPVP